MKNGTGRIFSLTGVAVAPVVHSNTTNIIIASILFIACTSKYDMMSTSTCTVPKGAYGGVWVGTSISLLLQYKYYNPVSPLKNQALSLMPRSAPALEKAPLQRWRISDQVGAAVSSYTSQYCALD